MEELYIETGEGRMPIDPQMAKKYGLEVGMLSPYTNFKIVGKNGEFPKRLKEDETPKEKMEETENIMFETSEILDFADAQDSSDA